jgi:hypothetical protein
VNKRAAFKARGQLRKASKLLSIVDRNVRLMGVPQLAGKRGVAALEVFGLREWRALARQHGIVIPSRDVIPIILRLVAERGDAPALRQLELRKTSAPVATTRKRESA